MKCKIGHGDCLPGQSQKVRVPAVKEWLLLMSPSLDFPIKWNGPFCFSS